MAALHAGSFLAALQPLSENSRQGHPLSTVALYPGIGFVNSNPAKGLRVCLYDDGRRSRDTGKERDSESGLDYFGARYYGDAGATLTAEYSTGASALVVSCTTCYYSYDHLGNVRMVTDQAGKVVARHDYLPFGEEVFAGFAGRDSKFGANDNLSQRFTGKEADAESGLHYFGARYYGSALGRFTSADDPFENWINRIHRR